MVDVFVKKSKFFMFIFQGTSVWNRYAKLLMCAKWKKAFVPDGQGIRCGVNVLTMQESQGTES